MFEFGGLCFCGCVVVWIGCGCLLGLVGCLGLVFMCDYVFGLVVGFRCVLFVCGVVGALDYVFVLLCFWGCGVVLDLSDVFWFWGGCVFFGVVGWVLVGC